MPVITVKIVDGARGNFEFDFREPTAEEEDEFLVRGASRIVGGRLVDESSAMRRQLFDRILVAARKDGEAVDLEAAKRDTPGRFKFMAIFQAFENFSAAVVDLQKN